MDGIGGWWKMTKTVFVLWILLSAAISGFSQQPVPEKAQQDLERITEEAEIQQDFTDLLAGYTELQEQPLNLNRATAEELKKLPFLNESQRLSLQQYLETYGAILSLNELQAVPGFDSLTIVRVTPFLRIGPTTETHPLKPGLVLREGRQRLMIRYQQVLEEQAGYLASDSALLINPNAGYAGSPQKYWIRYRFDYYDRLTFGFSGEKDEGEQFFRGVQRYGMDYYAGYIQVQRCGFLRNLILGNYTASFGQGLVLGTGASLGSLPGAGAAFRSSDGFRPSLSMSENDYMQGAAVTIRAARFTVNGFYSGHRRDAGLVLVDSLGSREFTSFQETGDHRTASELETRKALRETIAGGNISFRTTCLKIGITGFYSSWSASRRPADEPYNRFVFQGRENWNGGADLLVHLPRTFLFAEAGVSRNGGIAWLGGIQFLPDPRLGITAVVRDYQRNYQDLRANAVGRNSANANEQGVCISFAARILPGLGLSGFVDFCRFPWLKYRTNLPSTSTEGVITSEYTPGKSVSMYFRYRYRDKQINESEHTGPVTRWITTRSHALRYNLEWSPASWLILRNRLETVWNTQEGGETGRGYMASADLGYRPEKVPVSLYVRYVLFDTDSYDERIYAYEQDVLYGYSVPAYEGSGQRVVLLISAAPARFITIWLRYGRTWYFDRQTVGTGLEMSEGNVRSELKVQVSLKF